MALLTLYYIYFISTYFFKCPCPVGRGPLWTGSSTLHTLASPMTQSRCYTWFLVADFWFLISSRCPLQALRCTFCYQSSILADHFDMLLNYVFQNGVIIQIFLFLWAQPVSAVRWKWTQERLTDFLTSPGCFWQ